MLLAQDFLSLQDRLKRAQHVLDEEGQGKSAQGGGYFETGNCFEAPKGQARQNAPRAWLSVTASKSFRCVLRCAKAIHSLHSKQTDMQTCILSTTAGYCDSAAQAPD